MASIGLASCAGGFSLSRVEADRSLITSAVTKDAAVPVDSQTVSDQMTIRNAVSSANLEELGGQELAWANTETDSRGSIFDIVEVRKAGSVCRSFKTSREAFDGVSVYSGEACSGQGGAWYMRIFRLLQ